MKKLINIACLLLSAASVTAQTTAADPGGTYIASNVQTLPWIQRDDTNKRPLPYEYQREADVAWSKNIWRVIDIRQKMNLPFGYEQEPLIKILHEAAKHGEINVYDAAVLNADQFKQRMDTNAVQRLGVTRDTSWVVNAETLNEEQVAINNDLTWDKIKKFRVKEVWFFDTKTSSMQVRIIAIAPVMEDYDASGNYRGDMTMYWIPFESIRPLLAKHKVFNALNDWQQMSWDDLFTMRRFESYITKESNVYDRSIQEYATGVDAQVESDRIKQEIFEKEHDMWNY